MKPIDQIISDFNDTKRIAEHEIAYLCRHVKTLHRWYERRVAYSQRQAARVQRVQATLDKTRTELQALRDQLQIAVGML